VPRVPSDGGGTDTPNVRAAARVHDLSPPGASVGRLRGVPQAAGSDSAKDSDRVSSGPRPSARAAAGGFSARSSRRADVRRVSHHARVARAITGNRPVQGLPQ